MPNLNISFGGSTLALPGVYVYGNVQAQFIPPTPAVPPLLYVGYGYGVKPKTAYTFYSGNDLLNALRGGPASAYVQPMINPGPALNGAGVITFIDASENTQASGLISTASTGVISLVSTVYGAPANLIQVGVFGASMSGVAIEVYDGYTNQTVTGDNLGYPFFIGYNGTATTGLSWAVCGVAGAVTGFVLKSPNAGESFSIQLGSATYPTVQSLVQYINGTGYWAASVANGAQVGLASTLLDPSSGVATGTVSSSITYYGVPATIQGPLYWLNQYATNMVSGSLVPGATTGVIKQQGLTPLSGAAGVAPTLNDYAAALNVGLGVPAWAVFMDNNSLAAQALGSQHAETASQTQYSSWRRFFTGSSPGDLDATTIGNSTALDAKTTCYLYPGLVVVNTSTGLNQTYGGLYAAAAAAGAACGNFVALPLTNKVLNGVTVEKNLTTSELVNLQNSGVMTIDLLNNVPTIISDVTTWQGDNNPENVFTQQVACLWWTCYSLVAALQPYIGGVAAPRTQTSIGNAVKRALNSIIYTDMGLGASTNGVLAAWDAGSLAIAYNGATQQWNVSVNVQLVGQKRFITVTVFASPYSTTVQTTTA